MIVTPELFLVFANSLPEPMVLASSDGSILALNRAFEKCFGMSGQNCVGKPITDMVVDTPEEVVRYLQLCSRSRQAVLGAMTVRARGELVCRAEGCLIRPKSEGSSALLMLRLVPKQTAAGQFITLNLQIGELGREIRRRKIAELEALESAERLRTTLASIGDGVIATDVSGRITNMNPVAELLTKWTNAEAMGQPLANVFRIVNESTRLEVENPAVRALREGVIVGLANHTILIAKDGTESHIDDSAAPIRCKAGEIVGSVLVFRDINERRRMERQLAERLQAAQRLSDIVESSADAIISKSLDGIICSWNAAAELLFGYSAAEAIGRHISLVIPAERLFEEEQIITLIRGGNRVEHFETMRMGREGRSIYVSLSISPVRDDEGRIIGASKIVRDITERKRADEDLRRLAAKLSEADRRKDEFLATLAHELRNPLAPIRNGLQIMRLSHGNEQSVEDLRAMMERQLDQMVHLIDDLLDVSRISQGKLELRKQRIDLATVLNQAVETSRFQIEASGHVMTLSLPSEPIFVVADVTRLGQVFSNLLNNAAKFSDRGGHIEVAAGVEWRVASDEGLVASEKTEASVEWRVPHESTLQTNDCSLLPGTPVRRGGDEGLRFQTAQPLTPQPPLPEDGARGRKITDSREWAANTRSSGQPSLLATPLTTHYSPPAIPFVVVRVKDTGVGIPADMLPRIFDLFTQVDQSLEKSQGGLGIGLSLVQRLVEMHGGSVEARSEGHGKGSEFFVRLPVDMSEVEPASQTNDVPVAIPSSKRRILVADDNKDAATTLAMMLKYMGHDAHTANDGLQAVEVAELLKPDVIFLDIGMPKLNGYEACRRIREQPWGEKIVLIALTGWGQDEDKRQSQKAGFNHHLVKPVDPAVLKKLLASLLPVESTPL